MNSSLKEQYVVDADGNKTAVILSIEQYEQIMEDLHDLAIVADRRSAAPVSIDTMKEWLQQDGTI
jgi:PHD/YefM family antitoxin component YafN of YafNO toxin-antitoxin module